MPIVDDDIGFERDIKPLFREMDRESMRHMFDLWSYDDVRNNAETILNVLQQGAMPCDGAWPAEQTERFQRWTQSGMPA
jgi:hypothetical protein